MNLLSVGAKLNEENIKEFEKALNIRLPQDYIEFLIKNNGGTPEGNLVFDFYDIGNSKEDSTIISFFEQIYLANNSSFKNNHIKAGYCALVDSRQIPPHFLPIADDVYGNIIFICTDGKDRGNVFFGDHELEVKETGYIVLSKIANSFTEFLNKLYLD